MARSTGGIQVNLNGVPASAGEDRDSGRHPNELTDVVPDLGLSAMEPRACQEVCSQKPEAHSCPLPATGQLTVHSYLSHGLLVVIPQDHLSSG